MRCSAVALRSPTTASGSARWGRIASRRMAPSRSHVDALPSMLAGWAATRTRGVPGAETSTTYWSNRLGTRPRSARGRRENTTVPDGSRSACGPEAARPTVHGWPASASATSSDPRNGSVASVTTTTSASASATTRAKLAGSAPPKRTLAASTRTGAPPGSGVVRIGQYGRAHPTCTIRATSVGKASSRDQRVPPRRNSTVAASHRTMP